jgi:DNA-binding NarL/FixJ family response regulator
MATRPRSHYASTSPPHRLTDEEVRLIRLHRANGASFLKIARMFHVSEHTVAHVVNYRNRYAAIR